MRVLIQYWKSSEPLDFFFTNFSNDKTGQLQRKPSLFRIDSGKGDGAEICPASEQDPIEYFFASDASAIIEHTDRVLYLQDNDVASVKNGKMSIHRLRGSIPGDSPNR